MKTNKSHRNSVQMLAIMAGLFGLATTTFATNGTWSNTAGGSWATSGNWSGSTIADGTDGTADFSTLTLGSAPTVTLDGARTIGNLIFGDVGNTYGWTLSTGGGDPLTLAVSSGSPTITANGPINTIGLVLAGTQGFTKAGSGTLALSVSNSYTGGTTINAGTVKMGNKSALGTAGTVTVNSAGTLDLGGKSTPTTLAVTLAGGTISSSASSASLNSFVTLSGGGSIGGSGTTYMNWQGGAITGTGDLTITGPIWAGGTGRSITNTGNIIVNTTTAFQPNTATFQCNEVVINGKLQPYGTTMSAITGSGSLVLTTSGLTIKQNQDTTFSGIISGATGAGWIKSGSYALTLTGINTYTGGTTVSNGTLLVNSPGSTAVASAVTVLTNATMGGSGTVQGTVAVNNGGSLLIGASSATLTLSNAAAPVFSAGSTLKVLASASALDKVSVIAASGNSVANVNLVIDVTGLSGSVASTTIFSAGGAITGPFHSVTVTNGAYLATLDYGTSGQIKLALTPGYTVTYNGNGNDGGTVPVDTGNPHLSGSAVTVMGNTGTLTKVNYAFNGWNTAANGSGTTYVQGNFFNIVSNTTLYAIWGTVSATIASTGSLSAFSTTYGTASSAQSVSVSGANLTASVIATAPTGLEVSSDGLTYGTTATFTESGGNASGTLHVRLAATAPVSGSYDSNNIVLSSPGAISVNVVTASSGDTVAAKALTIPSATVQNKMYDGTTAATLIGTLQSPEAFGAGNSADGKPYIGDTLTAGGAGTFANSAVGNWSVTAGTFTLGGAAAGNYTVTQPTGFSLTASIVGTGVWTNTIASANWGDSVNWTNGIVATNSGNTADFSQADLVADATVNLATPLTIGNLIFGDANTNTAAGWTLANNLNPANILTLDATTPPTVTVNALGIGKSVTISAVVAGTNGLTKTGNGTLILSAANTYTNGTTINAGTVKMGVNNALGTNGTVTVNSAGTLDLGGKTTPTTLAMTLASGTITSSGGSLNSPVTLSGGGSIGGVGSTYLNWQGGNITGTGDLTIAGPIWAGGTGRSITNTGNIIVNTTTAFQPNAGTFQCNEVVINGKFNPFGTTVSAITGSGSLILSSSGNMLTVNQNIDSTFSGIISGIGSWTMSGPYALTLTGTSTYTGNTTISAGTLALGDGSGAGTLGTGTVYNNATLVLNSPATVGNYITGSGVLLKVGSGATILTGGNDYAGTTTVSNGILYVNGSLSASAVDVKTGATLGGQGSVSAGVTVENGATLEGGQGGSGSLNLNSLTLGTSASDVTTTRLNVALGASVNGGTVTVNGTNYLQVVGAPPPIATYNLVSYSGSTPFSSMQLAPLPNGMGGYLYDSGSAVQLVVTNTTVTGPCTWAGNVSDTWNLTNSLDWKLTSDGTTPTLYYDGAYVTFNDSAANFTVSLINNVSPADVQVTSASNYLFTGNGTIMGATALTVNGPGTLTLANSNSYTGGTTINGGTLQLGNGGSRGSVSGDITDNTTLIFNRSDALTYANVISGPGAMVKQGAGIVTLSKAQTYTGTTVVSNGTLLVNGSLAAASAVTVNAGATLGGTGIIEGSVDLRGTISPGASVGTLTTGNETWNGGAAYVFQLTNAATAGGWDTLAINGTLDVATSTGGPITIKLTTLAPAGGAGPMAGFSKTTNYSWTIATTTGGILNFAPAGFVLDSSAVSNDFSGGTFSVATNGNALVVDFTGSTALTPPTLSGYGPLNGTSFPLTFNGPSGQTYKVLWTTNVALPLAQWMTLATGTFAGSPVTCTDTGATNSQRFYRITSP
jgi:autotransporter-associated beta strand protein